MAVVGDPKGARMESWWLSSHWSGDDGVNGLQYTPLALTWPNRRSDRSDPINGGSSQALVLACFIPTVLLNLHLQQFPNPYLLGSRRRWLRVNCVNRIGIWPVQRTWKWQRRRNLPSARVYWRGIPIATKVNGFLLGSLPTQVELRSWWWNAVPAKNMQHIWPLQLKNEINETCHNQTRIIRHQTSPDSLLLNIWRKSARPNSRLFS